MHAYFYGYVISHCGTDAIMDADADITVRSRISAGA
jgi:hypothetical protein